jgi:class 3 adenylate cyclase
MLALVSTQASRYVDGRLLEDLRRGHDLAVKNEVERLRRLETTARVIGSFPALKALIEQTDEATVRDALIDYRQEHLPTGLLAVLATDGRTLAWTDALSGAALPDVAARWATPALREGVATGTLALGDRVFHAAAVPVDAAGTVFGYLLAAAPIDDGYAQELREAARDEVVILGPRSVLASTILRDRLPWRDASGVPSADMQSPVPFDVELDGERYTALAVPTAPGERLAALTLQSRDLALGLVAIGAGIAGSAMLARSITRPVAELVEGTQAVARGNYEFELAVARNDELGELASSFNTMTRGLREREAMSKFVSQSTVEMIQAQPRRGGSGTERRRVTVFFSDIRGFTAMAERLTPEEAISRLNQVLRAQAEIVARFKGDVDKFIGDAVFAVFSGDDMAVNAIRCGVEVNRAMRQLAESHPDMPIDVGIGIATGEVILGAVGSNERLDYTALGSTVNLGARLCSAAAKREILLSEETYRLVRDFIAAEPMEPVAVKGFAEPVKTFRMAIVS